MSEITLTPLTVKQAETYVEMGYGLYDIYLNQVNKVPYEVAEGLRANAVRAVKRAYYGIALNKRVGVNTVLRFRDELEAFEPSV